MDILTDSRPFRRLEIVETGRRRRWSVEEKQRIVAESHMGFRQASATARRHAISNTLLFAWRKEHREGRLGGVEPDATAFVPVKVGSSPPAPEQPGECGRMEVVSTTGRRIIVGPDVDTAALLRVLDALERR